MRINFNPNNTFKSKVLYPIKLKVEKTPNFYQLEPANFSQLFPNDKSDRALMHNIRDYWYTDNFVNDYSNSIAFEFFYPQQAEQTAFYVTELNRPQEKPIINTRSVMLTTSPQTPKKKFFDIHFLQSSSSIVLAPTRKTIGGGNLAVYGAVRQAKENGFEVVRVASQNDGFYKKLGFRKIDSPLFPTSIMLLKNEDFDKFLSETEKKYGIKNENK